MLIIISTLLGEMVYPINASQAYYMLYSRMGEILIGGMINMVGNVENKLVNEVLGLIGISLSFFSLFYINDKVIFPGFHALIPCLGCALLIYSGKNQKTLVKKVLSFQPFIWLGLVSYSAYLYHWPFIVLVKLLDIKLHFTILFLIGVALTLSSYFLIESPLRFVKISKISTFFFLYVLPCIILILFASLFLMGSNSTLVNVSNISHPNQSISEDFSPPSYFNISNFDFQTVNGL